MVKSTNRMDLYGISSVRVCTLSEFTQIQISITQTTVARRPASLESLITQSVRTVLKPLITSSSVYM